MLSLQAANCAGWQLLHATGSRSSVGVSRAVVPPPHALPKIPSAPVSTRKRTDVFPVMNPSSMNHEPSLWHINGVIVRTGRSAVVVAALACTVAWMSVGCISQDAVACPSPAPTYSADVAPLIQTHCTMCHSPSGENQTPTLVTYDDVTAGSMQQTAHEVLVQIHACNMPPPDQPQLTSDERQAILGWIVCGAMNN